MIAAGAVEEVRALLALDLDPRLPAMKAVGVQQLAAYLRGEQELAAACAAAKTASRNYAKRQVTWLRHQLLADERIHEQFSERIWPQIRSFIRRILLTSDPSGTKWSCVGPA
jgi:tRNA dimethylallyltransferase